jgi:hypothetical protein
MLDRHAARPLAATLLTGAVLVTGATGCGSSKSSTSTQPTATASAASATTTGTSTTPSKTSGSPAHTTLAQRYASCLAQNGIKVPTVNGAPSFKGIDTSSAQYKKAAEKCRTAVLHSGSSSTAKASSSGSQRVHTVLLKYLICLRQNGVNVPASDLSGTPSFKGIDTSSTQYRQATEKCRASIGGGRSSATGSSKTGSSAASGRLHSLVIRYIACLRQNGVSVPSSDTSGVGSLKGVDTTSPQFKAARTKCVVNTNAKGKKHAGGKKHG